MVLERLRNFLRPPPATENPPVQVNLNGIDITIGKDLTGLYKICIPCEKCGKMSNAGRSYNLQNAVVDAHKELLRHMQDKHREDLGFDITKAEDVYEKRGEEMSASLGDFHF